MIHLSPNDTKHTIKVETRYLLTGVVQCYIDNELITVYGTTDDGVFTFDLPYTFNVGDYAIKLEQDSTVYYRGLIRVL